MLPSDRRLRLLFRQQTGQSQFILCANMGGPMRVVAVQQVTKQMEDGEFVTAIKTVVWVVNPKLHIGFLFTPFAGTFLTFSRK